MPDGFKSTVKAPLPTPPQRQFSFTNVSINTPTAQQPGDRMDAEYDRSNQATTELINFVAVTFNTDGSLVPGSVGLAQLDPTIVADITAEVESQVQPLVDDAQAYASSASTSASNAAAAEATVASSASAAVSSASMAQFSASSASVANMSALSAATVAQNSATTAQNAANETDYDVNLSNDLALVSQAWAEYMPDTIPPNILAVMNITGDHWSSRWWAHKASAAFGQLSELYLGVWPTPPSATSTGDPIPTGAIYYNSTSDQPFVWNGTEWVPFYKPAKSYLLTMLYRAAANQTVFPLGIPDLGGNTYAISPIDAEPIEVYLNGVRIPQDDPNPGNGDWTLDPATSTITFFSPLLAGTLVQVDVMSSVSSLAPARVQTQQLLDFNTDPTTGNPGQIDGVKTTFPLVLALDNSPVPVGSAQELFISVDGVVQEPGADYNVSGTNIVFNEAPIIGARAWGTWYGPGLTSSGPGAGYLPISGGQLTGPLLLAGPPTTGSMATTKAYVDSQTSGKFLPLSGGTVSGDVTIQGPAGSNAPGVAITPIGMYDALPNTAQSMLYATVNMGQGRGGPYFNPTFAGNFTTTVYGAVDQSAVGILGAVAFDGTGGVGQHCAIQAYANRYKNVPQPTTTIAVSLTSPGNTVSVADVSMFQMDYQPVYVNGHGYVQVAHSGTSGPGTISVDSNILVADGAAGNTVMGQNNPQLWGLNINVNDNTGGQNITSSRQSNYVIGCELDFGCSGADDGGQMTFGSPGGVRAMLTMIGNGGTSTTPAEIGVGLVMGRGGGQNVTWKRCIQVGDAPFSQSAFDTRGATQLSGANAIWLADGHKIAFDLNASNIMAGSSSGSLSIAGNGVAIQGLVGGWSASNIGKQLLITCPANWNVPALAFTDPGGTNYSAITGGTGFAFMQMPAPSSNTTAPTVLAQITATGINGTVIGHDTPKAGSFTTLNASSGTFTDPVSITDNNSGPSYSTLAIAAPNSGIGPNIMITGNAPTPRKFIGVGSGGQFHIYNDATTPILTLDDVGDLTTTGIHTIGAGQATINSGNGAPSTTRPVGSIYMRTDGAVGSTFYVSRGGGAWNAVAGV